MKYVLACAWFILVATHAHAAAEVSCKQLHLKNARFKVSSKLFAKGHNSCTMQFATVNDEAHIPPFFEEEEFKRVYQPRIDGTSTLARALRQFSYVGLMETDNACYLVWFWQNTTLNRSEFEKTKVLSQSRRGVITLEGSRNKTPAHTYLYPY